MISKLGVAMLLKFRNYPEYHTPKSEIKCGWQLFQWLLANKYIVMTSIDFRRSTHCYRITQKGADAIADNFDWLTARGYKV